MKNVLIKKNISCCSYNFEKKNSRSYIFDEELLYEYQLDGISSDIWKTIFSTKNYESIYKYAQKRHVEKELNQFLNLLEASNLISFENNLSQNNTCTNETNLSISNIKKTNESLFVNNCTNCNEFNEEKTQWLYGQNYLQELILQLGYSCNLTCSHCYNEKHYNEYELNFEQVKDIVNQAIELGITTVGITGGECTIHKDFLKICQYIRGKGLALNFLTNGLKLYDDKNFFNEIVALYPHTIKLSLYSMDPMIHDEMTGLKGSQAKTLDVIKRLRKRNVPVIINHLRVKKNLDSFYEILKFAEACKAKLSASSVFVINKDNNNSHLRLSEDDLVALYLDKKVAGNAYDRKAFYVREPNRTVCRGAEVVLSVAPNLDVTPCNDFNYPLGNLNNEKLSDIWNISVPKFRNIFLNKYLVECGKEEYCKYCEYCALRATQEVGFMKKSTTSCENAKAFFKALQIINDKAI